MLTWADRNLMTIGLISFSKTRAKNVQYAENRLGVKQRKKFN